MNPAVLSRLSDLFPPAAVVAELRGPGDPALLMAREAETMSRAVPKRLQEFAAGRLCARRALAEFGIDEFPLGVADDRQPAWPAAMVGSITHTADFCAAVVAERRWIGALGLDTEVIGAVKVDLWPRICVPAELAWIRSLPALQQASAITLVFSAKEAFYKCQYAFVQEPLTFHDVRIEAVGWGNESGGLRVHAMRTLALSMHAAFPVTAEYRCHEGLVSVGTALAAVPSGDRDLNTPCRLEIPLPR